MTTASDDRTDGRTVIGHLDDFDVAVMKMVKVDGHRLCAVRTGDGVDALDQACPPEGYGLGRRPSSSTLTR